MNDIFYTLRGLLIGLTVAFHLYLMPSYLFIQIAMGGFFLISGLFFKPKTGYQLLKTIVIPTVVISLISFWIIPAIAEPNLTVEYLRIAILICLWPAGNFIWFMWVLLILWGVTTILYRQRLALFGISLASYLILSGLPSPLNFIVEYAPLFLFGVVYTTPIRALVTNLALKIPMNRRLNGWLASVGYNSKYIYLTHLPYSTYVKTAFLNYAGINVSWPLVFIWLYASDKAINYYRGVLK